MIRLQTPRLLLEPFVEQHLDGLYAMNSQPEVMRYISGKPQTLEETRTMIERVQRHWREFGCSWWAFLDRADGNLIGAGCIQPLAHQAGNPWEIGWRLVPEKWGQGYASEAAQVMAAHAFDALQSPDLTAVCDPDNAASARVMQRLGMTYRGIERWYPVETAVYTMTREQFLARQLKR